MKRLAVFLISVVMLFSLCACERTIKGTDALIAKARGELPIADADTIELKYAGISSSGNRALIWFVSGNEYQAHYYLPIEFETVGANEYLFFHTHKPIKRGTDIAVVYYANSFSFIVNNPCCRAIRYTDSSGEHIETIEKDSYPYVFGLPLPPHEYVFLDNDGREVG